MLDRGSPLSLRIIRSGDEMTRYLIPKRLHHAHRSKYRRRPRGIIGDELGLSAGRRLTLSRNVGVLPRLGGNEKLIRNYTDGVTMAGSARPTHIEPRAPSFFPQSSTLHAVENWVRHRIIGASKSSSRRF